MNKELDSLFDILSHKRPHLSKMDEQVVEKYLDVIPKMRADGFGNRILSVGKHPTVMFSCHTDTVHHTEGKQKIFIDETREEVFLANGASNCLGADDGAGMWLMLQLIKAGKRGLYVFHRGEERGGLGSNYITKETPELLEGIKYCIAFDRKGTDDVITHQMSGRCCSDGFAQALSDELGGAFMPSARGVFTDSANYIHLIPECTNISVGYYQEHTSYELLEYGFLQQLSDKLRRITFETLPVERDPEVEELDGYGYDWLDDYNGKDVGFAGAWDEGAKDECWNVYDFVIDNPCFVSEILTDYGYTIDILKQEIGK